MNQTNLTNQSITATGESGGAFALWRPWQYKRELLLALVLLIASHVFVLTFGSMVRWEKDGPPVRLSQFCQWDCGWYSSIIRSGYDRVPHLAGAGDAANWNFFPVFPLSASPWFHVFGMESTKAAVVASKVALYFAILSFIFMVRSKSDSFRDNVLAATLVAFNPAIIYAHGGYAEPLYFALAATAFALLERDHWLGAGVAGGFLSATRMVGVVFSISYMIAALRSGAVLRGMKQRRLGVLLGALLCPAGLSLWMLFIYHRTGDALASVHIYTAWGLSSGNPVSILWDALQQRHWPRFLACTAIAGWAVSAWLITQRHYEMATFLALCILVPVTAEVGGMQRFVWWQPPTLYAAFLVLKRNPRLQNAYFALTGGMAAAMTILWFLNSHYAV